MKITSRDKELIFLVLSIGIVAASWFLGAKNIEKKTEEMTVRKEELRQEYDERIRILQQKDEYIQKTKDYNEAYTLMLGRYPGDISQVQQIMFVTGLEERFDTQVVSVSYTDPAEIYQFQTTEQGNIMETMIQQGVDAIALATESDESMLPYLREAAEADIPVFLFNMTEINDQNIYYVSSIGYDQEKAGYDIGKWINDNLGDQPQKIAVLEGYAGIVNTKRMDGFKSAIADNSNLEIVASQTADWTREKGQSVTESILTANPDVTILYAPYDEMALGGLTVVKERNLLDQISVVGYGCTKGWCSSD